MLVNLFSPFFSSDSSHNDDIMPLYYDKENVDTCPAFEDTKRKLRMVLSTGDVYLGLHQVVFFLSADPTIFTLDLCIKNHISCIEIMDEEIYM